jgi:hypothetical protein
MKVNKAKKRLFLCGHGKKWLGAVAGTHPVWLMDAARCSSCVVTILDGADGRRGLTGRIGPG